MMANSPAQPRASIPVRTVRAAPNSNTRRAATAARHARLDAVEQDVRRERLDRLAKAERDVALDRRAGRIGGSRRV
jgi:hypothetical protein